MLVPADRERDDTRTTRSIESSAAPTDQFAFEPFVNADVGATEPTPPPLTDQFALACFNAAVDDDLAALGRG